MSDDLATLMAERDALAERQAELRAELFAVNQRRMVNAMRLTQAVHRKAPTPPGVALERQQTYYEQARRLG